MRNGSMACLLLAFLLLTGCAAGDGSTTDSAADGTAAPPQTAAAEGAAVSTGGYLTAAQTETQARGLTEEEILTAYDRAVTVYSWFDLARLPSTEESVSVDGVVYQKVDYRGMTRLEDLQSTLQTIFSEDVTARLLAVGGETPLYRDIQGVLFVAPGGRGRDPYKGAVQTQVEQCGDTAYTINVTVELLEEDRQTVNGVECWAFPYELTEDRWVFTDFHLVY